jgi:hypothetical protein
MAVVLSVISSVEVTGADVETQRRSAVKGWIQTAEEGKDENWKGERAVIARYVCCALFILSSNILRPWQASLDQGGSSVVRRTWESNKLLQFINGRRMIPNFSESRDAEHS